MDPNRTTIMSTMGTTPIEKMTRREKNLRKAVQRAFAAKSLKDAKAILDEAMSITPQELLENEAKETEDGTVRDMETATTPEVENRDQA